jgi:hypothetical protein
VPAAVNARVARWYTFRTKIPIWVNFERHAIKDVGQFYGHSVYFTAISYTILWPFVIFCGYFGYIFSRFGNLYQEKSGNPGQPLPPSLIFKAFICSSRSSSC